MSHPSTTDDEASGAFRTGPVATIAAGHFIHDVYTSFVAPLLPLLIKKLDLSLTQAGSLWVFQQLPALANPLLGAVADRAHLRWLVVLAPATTALCMGLIGVAPGYATLCLILLVAGISNAVWHVPAPALVARLAGGRVGLGMSLFMLGGELARSVGPLIAVAAVSLWTLEGLWRTLPLGVVASGLLWWRLRSLPPASRTEAGDSIGESWRSVRRVMLPITGILGARAFMMAAMTTFLPTLLTQEGAGLWFASGTLATLELAGAAGAMIGGTLSDRIGRRRVLLMVMASSPLVLLLLLAVRGWLLFPVAALLGLLSLSIGPVLLALVQESARGRPATANGIYMATSFFLRAAVVLVVGALADVIGLRAAFFWSAILGLGGLFFALGLPPDRGSGDEGGRRETGTTSML